MRTSHLKLIIWLLLLGLSGVGAWAAVSGAANLLAYFQYGAEPASALNIVPNAAPDLYVGMDWMPDAADPGRSIEPLARSQVESAYTRAWLQWNLSYLKGEAHGLSTYFTGPALVEVSAAVKRAQTDGLRIEQADTQHRLALHFYSAEGSLVAFSDHDVVVVQVIRDQAGNILSAGETRADYDVVMLLEEGQWHIRHWVRRVASVPVVRSPVAACPNCVTTDGTQLQVNAVPLQIAGMNYYPQATPWDYFWAQYNPAIIDRDLSRIKGLGLNTIRIFVPYAQFGGPEVESVMVDRLADLLNRAQAQNLYVIVTLFDFRVDYDLLHWPNADRHLETLLTRFAEHPAILAWDLKNEPNLDDDVAGAAVIDAWLRHVANLARHYDPNHLLTIGWSSPVAAQRLADQIDLVQFHFYAQADAFASAYAELRQAAPEKPLLLGEFGLPTWNTILPNGHTEAEQATYYAALLSAVRNSDAAGSIAWTLYDFSHVPASVAGRWPWQTGPQAQMGVLHADGSAKPAATLLMPDANLNIAQVPTWMRFLKPFWLMLIGIGMVLVTIGSVILKRRYWP